MNILLTEQQLLSLLNELDQNDVITLTPEWLSTEYNRLNNALFENKLGACDFAVFTTGKGSQGTRLGVFKITGKGLFIQKSNRRIFFKDIWDNRNYVTRENFVKVCKPRIELNGNYTWTRKSALTTLVHEMCHYYCNMDGYHPVQAHGADFRAIATVVSRNSNEVFTIERIASAEEVAGIELNSAMAERNKRRAEAKAARAIAVFAYMKNGGIRLMIFGNSSLVEAIRNNEANQCKKIVASTDPNLINFLFENGYNTVMRGTNRYWDVTREAWAKDLSQYNVEVIFE